MALNIEFDGKPRVKSVNTRKEIHGDDFKIGMDVTLVGSIDVEKHKDIVSKLFGGKPSDALTFWHADGSRKFAGLGVLHSTEDFSEGQSLELEGKSYEGVTLKKLGLSPGSKFTADFTVQVQISGVPHTQAGHILKCLTIGEVKAAITGQMDLLTEGERAVKVEEDKIEDVGGPKGEHQKGPADPLFEEARAHVITAAGLRHGVAGIQAALQVTYVRAASIFGALRDAKVLGDLDSMGMASVQPEAIKAFNQENAAA